MESIVPTTMQDADLSGVTKAYSGKRGCMCGCRGEYGETGRKIKAVARRMRELESEGHAVQNQVGCCYFLETDTRVYALYYV